MRRQILIQRLNDIDNDLSCEELELRRLANSLKVAIDRVTEANDPAKSKSQKQIDHLIFRRKKIEDQIQQEIIDKDMIMLDLQEAFKQRPKIIEEAAKRKKKEALKLEKEK